MLAGLLVAAFLGAGLYWLWQAFVLVVGAWYGAPGQALWPAVLRNPWAVIAIIVVTTFVLGLAPTRTLERESLWMLLWPALAIVIWVLAQPVAFGTQLWGGAVDQITRYVVGYLASFLLAWLCVAAVPD